MQGYISVKYFALLRELAGQDEERIGIEVGQPASALYAKLALKYAFPLSLSDIRVAVNDEFSNSDHPLADGDKVVFIPPVAGG